MLCFAAAFFQDKLFPKFLQEFHQNVKWFGPDQVLQFYAEKFCLSKPVGLI